VAVISYRQALHDALRAELQRDENVLLLAEWITTLFAGHVAKENNLLLPALTGSSADLAALLADMHHRHAGAQA
jgi:hypothetical protein